MALLDVSELLFDPDFVNTFYVRRATQSVDNNGRLVEIISRMGVVGSVQPASERTYDIFPEATRVAGAIEIFTNFQLTPPSESISSDELEWRGKLFTVAGVQDFSNYGAGMTVALCNLKSLLAPIPGALPNATVP